jgi:signal transduction histidine kinase
MKPEDWVGQNLWTMFPKYVGKLIESEFRAAMEKQEIRRFESTSEYSDISYLVTISPSVEGISVLATDITERKKIEKQLQDQERLAAIGATAGMVGHDIRNPLQAIVSELFLAKQAMDEVPKGVDTHDALESINLIQDQVDYISKIVADLQDYSKTLKPALVEVDICSCISETLKTVAIPDNIQTSIMCNKYVPLVLLDRTFLQRILTNLAINAVQAMPKGGKLTINIDKDENDVIIFVKDTGFGIPEKIKEKLFTPLFTTKAKGQGFGLSVVKRMTESLGGTVTFESEEGKGTTFFVRLPLKKN